jgi:anti-sigma regulatory factor (Ser/Thr protein kinase)
MRRSGRPFRRGGGDGFRHDAFFYSDEQEFVDRLVPFIRGGLARHEAVLVVVDAVKIDLLCAALDGDAQRVDFADMVSLGRNPARIIPAWQQFVAERLDHVGGRGIGEPIWPDRSSDELVECQYHEALLNLAFAEAPAFRLLCPYDVSALDQTIIVKALRSHPTLTDGQVEQENERYCGTEEVSAFFGAPLPDPSGEPRRLAFHVDTLAALRIFVHEEAVNAGLSNARTNELILAINELATNSLRYGGGQGTLTLWPSGDGVICDVRDGGRITQPLVGRQRPTKDQEGGRGLWMVNQLCDLVQIRSSEAGTAVRLHLRR